MNPSRMKVQEPTPGGPIGRRGPLPGSARLWAAVLAAACACLALLAPAAQADVSVCPGTGSCKNPRGLAVDFETGVLYVADSGNNRIDLFKNGGTEQGTPASFGGLSSPTWIAVDNVATSASHHDLYAVQGFAVKKFSPTGTLLDEFGEQGDGTPEGCQLERADDPIAVGPNGDVYLADSYNTTPGVPKESEQVWESRVVKFDDEGNCVGAVTLFVIEAGQSIRDLAVNSSGQIYVTVEGDFAAIRHYDGSGALVKRFESRETKGLAVDEADHLFAEQRGTDVASTKSIHFFTEYSPGGAILRRFGYAPRELPGSVALAAHHSADGDLYASDGSAVTYRSLPDPGPVLYPGPCHVKDDAPGAVRATLQAELNPEGKETSFRFEYLTQRQYEEEGDEFKNAQSSPTLTLEEEGAPVEDFELHEAAQTVEPLEPETEYRCRIVAANADSAGEGTIGEEGTFETTEPFVFGASWTAEVTQSSAFVDAEGNPNGAPTSVEIEYVTDAQYEASGFAEALSAPDPPLDYGASEGEMILRGATLTGLQAGTLYHYRLRAFQPLYPEGLICRGAASSCPELEHTFRTYAASEPKPDDRGYELVSPGQKNSAEVGGPNNGRGFIEPRSVLPFAAAPSGEAVTYTSWTSFGQAQGAPATSQYLSTRTPEGWQTDNISPFGFQANLLVPPYLGFSADLGFGAVKAGGPGESPLAPGCPAGLENVYLREPSGALRCLTTEAPEETDHKFGYYFTYGGASEDGSRVFFRSEAGYAGTGSGVGLNRYNLYEWHQGQLHPVGVLPGQSEPIPPTGNSAFGAKSFEPTQTGQTFLAHAISADGAKVIWTYGLTGGGPSQLLDRIDGAETVQLDAVQSGKGKAGEGLFWAASTDGGVVYFTDENRLTSASHAASGSPDLYRYDFARPEGERLTDVSAASGPAGVQGVLGASDDGARIYFVATAALTPPSEEDEAGEHSEAGKDNLYLYDATEDKTSFIATLSEEDDLDWETQPKAHTARVSPDGMHLAFLSTEAEALAGYDNTLVESNGRFGEGKHCQLNEETVIGSTACPQAFLYDAQHQALHCASCNPAGSRPLGPATLPGWTNMAEGPRYLSDDGSRLFFESFDRLLPADESPKRDVYEFELPNAGSCSAANPGYVPSSGGCLFLVSGGRSEDENHLIDASADGRDVFFSTRERLLPGRDSDERYDLYDYRAGGGFAEPAEATPCGSPEACKPPPSSPPSAPSPATPAFAGSGNPKPKAPRCRKGKVRRKGRCVRRHAGHKRHAKHRHKHGKARKKHAAKRGRAGR